MNEKNDASDSEKKFPMSPIQTTAWEANIQDVKTDISISLSKGRKVCIVAVSQANGIGSVFDASEDSVQCLLGARREGLEDACALALLRYLDCERLVLTIAMPNISQDRVRVLLAEVGKKFIHYMICRTFTVLLRGEHASACSVALFAGGDFCGLLLDLLWVH